MTFEEFELKFAELVAKYGFVKYTWHYVVKPDKDYWKLTEIPFGSNFIGVCYINKQDL